MYGQLAAEYGYRLEVEVMQSPAGFYIGTHQDGEPITRESEYFRTASEAQIALANNSWCQRDSV